jgi:hypothetical protein
LPNVFRKRSGNVIVIAVPGNINMIIGYVSRLMGLQWLNTTTTDNSHYCSVSLNENGFYEFLKSLSWKPLLKLTTSLEICL